MHPDDVVGAQQRLQELGEPLVHIHILIEEAGLELGNIEPVVEDGPEHRVGITKIVALVLGGGQLDGCEAALALDQIGLTFGLDLAVPAEPERAARARRRQGHGDAATCGALQIDNPVGDQDDRGSSG